MAYYLTSFCNHEHDLGDGKPIDHECYIIPIKALQEEKKENFVIAQNIMADAKPLKIHMGKKKK